MSAFRSKDCLVILRSRFATLRAGSRKSGSMATLMIVSCQFRESIIDNVNNTLVAFVIMLINVPVIARCAPTTSLLRRAMISPVFVLVKKRNDICCMWLYSDWRKSRMSPSPTVELWYLCATSINPETKGTTIIDSASRFNSA